MTLKIEITDKKHAFTVKLQGRLDGSTTPECDAEIEKILADGPKSIAFDMSELEYISSAGLRTVLATKKKVEKAGGKVVVINMQPPVAKVFEMANVLMHTEIFDSVESADIFLDAVQRRVQMEDFDMPDE